jgi:hypothetical protein
MKVAARRNGTIFFAVALPYPAALKPLDASVSQLRSGLLDLSQEFAISQNGTILENEAGA